jgi:hypothetical protein
MMDNSINGGIVDNDTHATTSIHLESIMVYPIKSCAGFSVRVWPLSDCGKLTTKSNSVLPDLSSSIPHGFYIPLEYSKETLGTLSKV